MSVAKETLGLLYRRRRFLQGLGGLVWLPLLPSLARAQAIQPGKPRTSFISMWIPHGVAKKNPDLWTPGGAAGSLQLNTLFEGLKGYESDLLFVHNLKGDWFDVGRKVVNDGIGHTGEASAFLTGQFNIPGKNTLHLPGESIDVTIARKYQQEPLHIGVNPQESDTFKDRITWRSQRAPAPKHYKAMEIYGMLFGSSTTGAVDPKLNLILAQEKSILDSAVNEISALRGRMDAVDKGHLDRAMDGLRRIEKSLVPEATAAVCARPPDAEFQSTVNARRMDQLVDLTALAVTCGLRNVVSMILWNYGGPTAGELINYFPGLDKTNPYGYHHFTHWYEPGHTAYDKTAFTAFNRYFHGAFARLVRNLKEAPAPDGQSALHHSIVMLGSQIGSDHDYYNAVRCFAGQAGGALRGNRLINANAPISNLLPSILALFGIDQPKVGLGTGQRIALT